MRGATERWAADKLTLFFFFFWIKHTQCQNTGFPRLCYTTNITPTFIIYRSLHQSVVSKERQLNTGEQNGAELWSPYNRRGTEVKSMKENSGAEVNSDVELNSSTGTEFHRSDSLMARTVPVVDGGPGQHHRVIVGPFGCVAPALLVAVPEVAASRVPHDSLWKTLPDGEGKIHLDRQKEILKLIPGLPGWLRYFYNLTHQMLLLLLA